MNSVSLIGNLCYIWDKKTTHTGKFLARNTLAVRKNKDETTFIPIEAWQGTAQLLVDHTIMGDQVGIVGRIDVSDYERDGKRHFYTYVTVKEVTFTRSRRNKQVND